ncbi:Vacuolar protein sorting-associated protein 41, partial [Linderina pennispora]
MTKSRRRSGDAASNELGPLPDLDSDNGTGATAVYNSSEQAEDISGDNDIEDEEYDDDEEYDEDDEEPALRYKRLGGNVQALFEKDTASALIASDRFLVLGTHWGHVVILDFEGNEIKRWRAHSATVNSVSIDLDNEYVASAGDDGRVVICALYSDEIIAADYSRPVKAVALDPMFSRRASRRFVSGGTSGQLIMNEKKWFGKSDTILFTSEGPIQTIQWQDNLIAWACDEGVQIYDTERGTRISQIARPEGSPRADLFRCRLHWRDARTLIVGWANCIQIVEMRERLQAAGAGDGGTGPSLFAEISVLFRTDFIICGLAMYRDQFLVLSYGDEELVNSTMAERDDQVPDEQHQQRSRNAQPPELRMINRNIEEVSSDVLALEGFQLLQPNDYGFAYCTARTHSTQATPRPDSDAASAQREPSVPLAEADTWFILSPKQLVSVHPRGLKDHVQWLTERDDYRQALLDIEEAYRGDGAWAMYRDQIKEAEYQGIGQSYAQMLMDDGNTKEAAEVCARALPHVNTPEAVEVWESWVFAFAEANALQAIVP